jgi:hypothetical protein
MELIVGKICIASERIERERERERGRRGGLLENLEEIESQTRT